MFFTEYIAKHISITILYLAQKKKKRKKIRSQLWFKDINLFFGKVNIRSKHLSQVLRIFRKIIFDTN